MNTGPGNLYSQTKDCQTVPPAQARAGDNCNCVVSLSTTERRVRADSLFQECKDHYDHGTCRALAGGSGSGECEAGDHDAPYGNWGVEIFSTEIFGTSPLVSPRIEGVSKLKDCLQWPGTRKDKCGLPGNNTDCLTWHSCSCDDQKLLPAHFTGKNISPPGLVSKTGKPEVAGFFRVRSDSPSCSVLNGRELPVRLAFRLYELDRNNSDLIASFNVEERVPLTCQGIVCSGTKNLRLDSDPVSADAILKVSCANDIERPPGGGGGGGGGGGCTPGGRCDACCQGTCAIGLTCLADDLCHATIQSIGGGLEFESCIGGTTPPPPPPPPPPPAGPAISSFTPGSGAIGTVVTIQGQNLGGVQNVFFNGQVAAFQEFPGGAQLRATVPPGATSGPLRVATAAGSATSTQSFTVASSPPPPPPPPAGPTITSFSPTSGPPGTAVQIFGSGFLATTQVRINNVPSSASFSIVSDNQLSATVQPVATSGPISVITTAGTAFSPGVFTVPATPQQPSISFFSPASGGVGTQVTVQGQNLSVVQNVFFNGQVAVFQEMPAGTQLRTTVPPGATSGPIRVVTAAGSATSAQSFTVASSPPPPPPPPAGPTITSFSPTSGPPGTAVQIFGSGFLATTQVRINNVPSSASFSIVSDNQLSATAQPVATSGPISVITTAGTAVSPGVFTIPATPAQPSIAGFSPASGGVGTQVTIQGQNLSVVQNVFFNGQVAVFQEMSGGTQLRTTVPPGATSGPLRVVTAAGSATSTQSFTVP